MLKLFKAVFCDLLWHGPWSRNWIRIVFWEREERIGISEHARIAVAAKSLQSWTFYVWVLFSVWLTIYLSLPNVYSAMSRTESVKLNYSLGVVRAVEGRLSIPVATLVFNSLMVFHDFLLAMLCRATEQKTIKHSYSKERNGGAVTFSSRKLR